MPNTTNYVSLIPKREEGVAEDPTKAGLEGFAQSSSLIATGAQLGGPWGAAIGGVAAAGKGIYDWISALRASNKERKKLANEHADNLSVVASAGDELLDQQAAAQGGGQYYVNMHAKKGGELPENIDLMRTMAFIKKKKQEKTEKLKKHKAYKFRSGGAVNVIAKGVSHDEENNIGDKGIPIVVKDGKQKIAEIELNEIVFHKRASDEIKYLAEVYKNNPKDKWALEELGNFVKKEILENTVDNQGELL